jgi:hypothetical protein
LRLLADVQAEFAAALRDPTMPPPEGIVGPDRGPAPRRFAVYRNNVIAGLTNAVTGSYPAVGRIVGAEFFRAMARAFVIANPPHSPLLLDYGADFPAFIKSFEPARTLPYLADVARIERAWQEAYHAEDAVPIEASALAEIPEVALADVTFRQHPSLRIVRSAYPAATIWRMNSGDDPVSAVDFTVAEDVLIVRPDAEVAVRVLPPGGGAFIEELAAGEALGTAAASGLAADDRFDLAGNLAGLIASGAWVEVRVRA